MGKASPEFILRLAGLFVAGVLLLGGCGKRALEISGGRIPVRPDVGDRTLTSLDYEAAEKAAAYWKLANYGDSWYLRTTLVDPLSRQTLMAIFELRKPAILVQNGASVTEADKLNHVEWQGSVGLSPEAARSYHDYNQLPFIKANTWSEWGSVFMEVRPVYCEKKNGTWNIVASDPVPVTFFKLAPSELPQGASTYGGLKLVP